MGVPLAQTCASSIHALAFDITPLALIVMRSDGTIRLANRQAAQIYGYAHEELIDQSVNVLLPARFRNHQPLHQSETVRLCQLHAATEWIFQRKDGEEFPARVSLQFFDASEGRIALMAVQDVGKGRCNALPMCEHASDATSSNQEADEFLYVAAHDLEGPLRKLSAFSDLLKRDLGESLSPQAQLDVDYILSATAQMRSLIHNLLDLSRTGQSPLRLAPTTARTCVDRALGELDAAIQEAKAVIRQPNPLPTLSADPDLLTKVFQQLLDNALKFRSGDRRPDIEITAENTDGEIVVGVRDNGIGVEREFANDVFLPFKRLHSKREYAGSGLGLAICRKAVQRHHGRIWVEAAPGGGAHFKFTLGGANGTDVRQVGNVKN